MDTMGNCDWMLRLRFLTLFLLLQIGILKGNVISTTPSSQKNDSTDSRTKVADLNKVDNNSMSRDAALYRPTLQPYRDFPAGTGVGSWQEIVVYPTKDTRNSRTLTETTAAGLASKSSNLSLNSLLIQFMLLSLTCFVFSWRCC